ncbi:MAG: hypothetical protein K9G83_04770 [Hyphomonadaceae bacterium]|jgi:hypothetical protein|nr:hypothetical protein [Hyphomonadaceae bacterium]
MRGFVVLLVLMGLAGAGAWYTRPSHGLHRGVASSLMAEGRVARPEQAAGAWAFDDFLVATRSTMTSDDRELLECWGFFSRFLCTGSAPQAEITVSG